jgi:hypothetical protein
MVKSIQSAFGLILLFLAMLGVSTSAAAADTLRCGSRLVSLGDTKAEVLIKCGAPAWKDNWTDEIINNVNRATELRVSIDRERWIYNFGPHSFLEFLLFENGKLIDISSGDYGYDEKHPVNKVCDSDEIKKGLTQYEIMQRCGEPFFKDTRNEERLITVNKHTNRLAIIRIDEWTYNFGPNQFLRILKFENGKLVDVETGDRGF